METSFWLWACFYSPCLCFLLLLDQARATRTSSKKPFPPAPHVVIPQIFMVRPLPTGLLPPPHTHTGALSLNLTWQTLTLKVSMRPGPGACLGGKLVLPLVLLGLSTSAQGSGLVGFIRPQELKSMPQGARLVECSHWCRMPRSENAAFLSGRRGCLSLSWF